LRGRLTRKGPWRDLVALGSNRRHHRFGRPREVLEAALDRLEREGVTVLDSAPVYHTEPVGPSSRRYANSAALVETRLEPGAMLALAKRIERAFGRRPGGQRWASRVLDLDLVLWSGGCWAEPGLTIPHPLFRERAFVLAPAMRIAPRWRDPVSGLTVRQLHARLTRPRAIRRAARGRALSSVGRATDF
jgi:2-amino-4-hydroxy-6-hydroxymethyldihydropteridine diphosphokinase